MSPNITKILFLSNVINYKKIKNEKKACIFCSLVWSLTSKLLFSPAPGLAHPSVPWFVKGQLGTLCSSRWEKAGPNLCLWADSSCHVRRRNFCKRPWIGPIFCGKGSWSKWLWQSCEASPQRIPRLAGRQATSTSLLSQQNSLRSAGRTLAMPCLSWSYLQSLLKAATVLPAPSRILLFRIHFSKAWGSGQQDASSGSLKWLY